MQRDGIFGVRRGLCVRAALAASNATTSQSGAHAQTAPHSKNTASPVSSSTNTTLGHHQDSDFSDMSVLRGFPPKVIWIRIGNCTTRQIDDLF